MSSLHDRRREIKQALKGCLQDYVNATLNPAAERGKFNCPACGSSDALGLVPPNKDRWKCFSCGKSGDIFTLWNAVNGGDFAAALAELAARYGYDLTPPAEAAEQAVALAEPRKPRPASAPAPGAGSAPAAPAATEPAPHQPEPRRELEAERRTGARKRTAAADITPEGMQAYIDTCRAALLEGAAEAQEGREYLAARGISYDTAAAFGLGYDTATRRIVIPNLAGYQARAITPGAKPKYSRPRGLDSGLLPCLYDPGALAALWITEGEFDALSIWQAGGDCIALSGSTQRPERLLSYLAALPAPPARIVLWLDNDRAGREAAGKLLPELKAAGYNVNLFRQDPAAGKRDPNDILQQDPAALAEIIAAPDRYIEGYADISAARRLEALEAALFAGAMDKCLPTGFKGLDALLDGGLYPGLYTIGAISSLGKTTLCLQIADYIATRGADVLIISLEMSAAELIIKSLSRLSWNETRRAGVEYREIVRSRGGARQDPGGVITAARRYYREHIAPRVYIREGIGNVKAENVREYIAAHIAETGAAPAAVIIDYLQALCPADPRQSDKQAIDNSVLTLKRAARDYNLPILAISSLNRANYQREISFEAFKESGAVEYGSDVVIGLQYAGTGGPDFDLKTAARQEPREIELHVLKNRFGRTGQACFQFWSRFHRFAELEALAVDVNLFPGE